MISMEVGRKMASMLQQGEAEHGGLNLKATELCLGLPGGGESESLKITGKRGFSETVDLKLNLHQSAAASADSSLDLKEKMKSPSKEPNKDPIKPPSK